MKLRRDIDTKDLIDIVKASKEEVVYHDPRTDEVKSFIIENNLKESEQRVSATLIYQAFLKWMGGSPYAGNMSSFFKKFSQYFKKISRNGYAYYLVEAECLELPEEQKLIKRKQHGKNKTE